MNRHAFAAQLSRPLGPLGLIALFAFASTVEAAPVVLVRNGRPKAVIYRAADAPASVRMGAEELRRYVEKATGIRLEIVTEPREPMICLGDTAAARKAGIAMDGIPLEGFRILTHGANLYIAGPDTPDGERTAAGGTSTGTRNGVYAFLERFLGIRWLMPGEHGDYVPNLPEIVIPEVDWADAPAFSNRRVPYTRERRPEVIRWWARQRLGRSLELNHGHNWRRPIPASRFDQHPDWFPERDGVRVPPSGRYKLCTTNPGLVRAFADSAIAYFDARPEATCFSLSPSDSAGWCECRTCAALYETDPNGERSVTPAILTFYNAVARLVAQRHPDKLLAAYVYASYVFPPSKPITLEPNVFLVWAPSFDYGFTLFRPALRKQWEALLAQWRGATANLSYYDLPVNILTEFGALNPPGLKILRFIYPRLKAADVKGVYVYGIEAWGRGAPLNYLLARLAWNPDADPEAIFDEYCAKAYGKGGPRINRLFRLLDAEMERHFLEFPGARYHLTTDMLRDIYARNWAEIERLVRAAEARVQDPDASARLSTIGMNLTVLHWNLRQFRLLDEPTASSFHLSDADFFSFLRRHRGSLALQPIRPGARPESLAAKLALAPARGIPAAADVEPFLLRGNQHLVLYPLGAGSVEVRFSRITARGKLVTYAIHGADGEEIATGLMSSEVPVRMDPAGSSYFHLLIAAGSASFSVEITGAAWSVDQQGDSKGLHLLHDVTPLYFEVAPGASSFHLSLEATPPGETALARLLSPTGREAARFDCTALPVDRKQITVQPGEPGWWKLIIEPAPVGVVDDVWVRTGDELSGFFSLVPEQALSTRTIRRTD